MTSRAARALLNLTRHAVRSLGIDVVRYRAADDTAAFRSGLPPDFSDVERDVVVRCRPYTLTSPERLYSVIQAVRYVVRHDVPGAIVECGVWKGGSTMCAILTLLELGDTSRDIFLYDTFSGMSEPTDRDVSLNGIRARDVIDRINRSATVGLEAVRQNVLSLGYPASKIHFVEGPVEQTLPAHSPGQIALLRLDTDWYESTRHELVHLYPRVAGGGVLIIDDYGHYVGARDAADEYIAEHDLPLLLHRVDYTGRVAVVPPRA